MNEWKTLIGQILPSHSNKKCCGLVSCHFLIGSWFLTDFLKTFEQNSGVASLTI